MRVMMEFGTVAIPVELNASATARALAERLPLSLRVSGSSVGCCGRLPFSLPYGPDELHGGWSDGDLNYKPAGDWLALFFDDEENSGRYRGQVTLGHAQGPLGALRGLAGGCTVRVSRARGPAPEGEGG